MIVAIDSTVLLLLIDPGMSVPADPETGERPEGCAERLDHFIEQLSKDGGRLIVPTPVLAEVLVHAGAVGTDWLNTLRGRKAIKVADFDTRAAIECAGMTLERPSRQRQSSRRKAKFDEQIVAIAIVENAEMILSDDADIRALAPRGVQVKGIADLQLPPEDPQGAFALTPPGPPAR